MAAARRRSGVIMLAPMVVLKRYALRRGLGAGKKSWIVIAVFLYSPKLMNRLFGRTEVLVARERLAPGQVMQFEALTDLSKAERKAIVKSK